MLLFLVLAAPAVYFFAMPETPLDRAIALVKSNKAAAALPILEEIAQDQPENMHYLPWLAQCYLATDRIAEARTALDTALKMKLPCQTVAPIALNFAKYYCQKNDFSEAERLLVSVQALCPSFEFQEERKEIYEQWAEYEISNNQIPQAISHLERILSLSVSKDNQRLTHALADLYRQQAAIEETQNGNDKKAIEILEKSLTIADEPASRLTLSNLYAKRNDFSHAIVHLRTVCKTDPNNLEARRRLVDMSVKLNDFEGAQLAASELADKERCVENYELLASLNLRLANFSGAVRALEEASTLAPRDPELLAKLEKALVDWSNDLLKQGKSDESMTVKTRAERMSDRIKALLKELNPDAQKEKPPQSNLAAGLPSIALTTARIWLAKGSLTPEGEIKMRNTGTEALSELELTVAFFDNTLKKRTGSVTVSAAGSGHPIPPGQSRVLYFSSPNIVKTDHQLSVLIFWKGMLIRELPVVKER